MTDAPRISDAEATAVYKRVLLADDEQDLKPNREGLETVRKALAAFLLARVPDAMPGHEWDEQIDRHAEGFNACRDAVLRGKE